MGYTIAVVEVAFILLPVNVLVFVPHFFFGSLLVFIACDLIVEWLVEIRSKVTGPSYAVGECFLFFLITLYSRFLRLCFVYVRWCL